MTPPHARTGGRRGQTPVVRVRGRSPRRISIAAMCCYRPGERSRLIYRPRFHPLLKGARKSLAWQDHRDLLVRAHLQLGAPIIVVRDNLNTHCAAGKWKYAADHEWLTVIHLPSCAPDLNPVEGIWSLLRRGPMANTAFTDPEHLTRTLRRGLAHLQRHPELIDGCLTETALTLISDHPKPIRSQSEKVSNARGDPITQ
ncbi:transposase [Streptomyces sp. NPDC048297]|uniref:transposase n=1 Tax=Streptomyces sp. NPDC048297 TaxID=3365531 RepID=UPI00371DF94B